MQLKPPQEPHRSGVERLAPKPDRERRHDHPGKARVGHAWEAIKPLNKTDLEYDFTFLDAWHDSWVA